MKITYLRRLAPDDLPRLSRKKPFDTETLTQASRIVADVRDNGEESLRVYAERFGDIQPGTSLMLPHDDLRLALEAIPKEDRALLERAAERIRTFAAAQKACLVELEMDVAGGAAGHRVIPLRTAGCYAPGGRYPMPSSVLMTAIPARVAGVEAIWVASPKPAAATLAAAAIAGVDGFLVAGGAQAIAAMAFGVGPTPPCDVIVGPGNRWVTSAKQIVSSDVAIDMLAGPSELVVLADETADAPLIAVDLLAQAEHDPDALPILVTTDASIADAVDDAIGEQLSALPTAQTARSAMQNGFVLIAPDIDMAIAVCDRLAPEHLELHTAEPESVSRRLSNYGGLFVGASAAEVFGDYGVGPNHVLPTGGTARFTSGLSVMTFLRARTWLRMERSDEARAIARDAAQLARMEGLEAHARSAERRP